MRTLFVSIGSILFFCLCALAQGALAQGALAQDVVGFQRSDFGKVVLSQKQFGGSLESSIGSYNNEPIAKYGRRSLFARLGRPVGRLDILTDDGVFPCTAFLISKKYILTNHHCVPGIIDDHRVAATRIEAVQLLLGYTRDGVEKGTQKFAVSPTPVEHDKSLDYAILEVFGDPAAQFGQLTLSSVTLEDSSPYWIIGHPMGEAQRISREDCQSDVPAVAAGRLRHRCDTLPGNSGSPVIDPGVRAAVALHHAGSSRKSINYAVPIASIAQHSKIISELANRAAGTQTVSRRQDAPGGVGKAGDVDQAGSWVGKWCLLKTRRSDKFCIDITMRIEDGTALTVIGNPGHPGYAKISGTVNAAGSAALKVEGITKRQSRRGRPYAGNFSGRVQNGQLRASGILNAGRKMTLLVREQK